LPVLPAIKWICALIRSCCGRATSATPSLPIVQARRRAQRLLIDAIHYAGMAIYKIGIILFNLVPYVALLIVA
jgi:hypothetical protein